MPDEQNTTSAESENIQADKQNPSFDSAQDFQPTLPLSVPLPEEIPPVSAEPAVPTAQIPVNEPLAPEPETFSQPKISLAREFLITARNAIQFRKRKKLDKVMSLFLKQSKVTNDEVEKFLHVSDATATRYLSQLEKEGKIQQNEKTGKAVIYLKI